MLMSLGSSASGAMSVGGDWVTLASVELNRRVGWYITPFLVRKLDLKVELLLCNLDALRGRRVRNEEAIACYTRQHNAKGPSKSCTVVVAELNGSREGCELM